MLLAGVSKIIEPLPLTDLLFAVELSPILVKTIMLFLPILEIIIATFLLLKIQIKETLILTSLLFLGFLSFSIYGLNFGLDMDCGCLGGILKNEIGLNMVIKNIILLGMVTILLMKKDIAYNRANQELPKPKLVKTYETDALK